MKVLVLMIISVFLLSGLGLAEEVLREIRWPDVAEENQTLPGKVIEAAGEVGFARIKVENTEREGKTFALLSIEEPGIKASSYALTGKVRYEGVEGLGYLEMWSCFPDGERYFSRTLGDSGPCKGLEGTSEWYTFALPFYIDGDEEQRPSKLEFNVVLPGKGEVYLGPLKLIEGESDEIRQLTYGGEGWWSDRTGGWIGGIGGSVMGIVGALIGVLGGFCVARRVVLMLFGFMFAVGVVSLAGGIIAVLAGQPYAVYYPLLLMGVICTVLPIGLYGNVKKRYGEAELRRMKSMDVS